MKRCVDCQTTKPLADFPRRKTAPDGHRNQCRDCVNDYFTEYREAHRININQTSLRSVRRRHVKAEESNKRYRKSPAGLFRMRARKLLTQYGMTLRQWESMMESQGNCCAACRKISSDRGWHTDHDHATGRVRGILCFRCNVGIGSLGDTPTGVAAALQYLEPAAMQVEEHW